jgi:hypothetical protein
MSIRTKVPALMIRASAAAIPIICMVAAVNMWYILSSTPVPSGKMAIVNLISLRDLLVSNLNIDALRTPSLIALLVMWLGGSSELNAVKASAAIGFSLVPLSVAITTYVLTRNAVLSALASVVSLFTPMLYTVAFSGDYTLLYSVTLSQTFLALMLAVLSSRRITPMVAALLVLPFAVLSDRVSPVLMLPAALSLALLAQVRGLQAGRTLALAITLIALSLFLFPLNINSTIQLTDVRQDIWFYQLSNSSWLLVLLVLSATAGIVTLYFLNRSVFLSAVVWLGVQSAAVTLFAGEVAVPALTPLLMVFSFPAILNFRQSVGFEKGSDNDVIIVIHIEKLLALALAGFLVLSLLWTGPAQAQQTKLESELGLEDMRVVQTAAHIVGEGRVSGKVAAPGKISGWLKALYGIDSVIPLSGREIAELDAATETTFRIVTKYIMADEWQPLSARRSPFIYHFDGSRFAKILHLDDGVNNMTVIESGKQWHEDMRWMRLVNYEWREDKKVLSLTINMWKKGFNVTKTITLEKDFPVIEIKYLVRPNIGVTLLDLKLPVYIEGRHDVRAEEVSGKALRITMPHVSLDIQYLGNASRPAYVKSPVQDFVIAQYKAENNEIMAGVRITLLGAREASVRPTIYSLFETINRYHVKYLLTLTPPPGLNFLEDSLEETNIVPVIQVKDSFARVLLLHEGVRYWESPAFSTVLDEQRMDKGYSFIRYRTAGLFIEKEVHVNGSSINLTYSLKPAKNRTELLTFTLSLWIDFDRIIFSSKLDQELGRVELAMDSGTSLLEVLRGRLIGIDVGPDPEFRQNRIQLQFALSPNRDEIGIAVKLDARPAVEYKPTTRPVMDGEDVFAVSVYRGLFKTVYSDEVFTLYQILRNTSRIS